MHIIEIKVQEYLFVQANIYGCYLPSLTSIESLLNKFKDKRNKGNFTHRANETTLALANLYHLPIHLFDKDIYIKWYKNLDWENISYNEVNKVLTKTIASQCYLNGCCFSRVIQSLFVVNWFGDLQDNVHLNWDKYEASLNYHFNLFFENKLAGQEYSFSYSSDVDSLEYLDAKKYYLNFLSQSEPMSMEYLYPSFISQVGEVNSRLLLSKFIPQIEQALSHNRQLKGFTVLSLMAMKKQVEFDKHGQRLCLCEGCNQKYFTKQKASTSNTCDSCQTKRKKQREASRRKDPKGWTFDRIGACEGEGRCEALRIRINTSGSCLKCHLLSL